MNERAPALRGDASRRVNGVRLQLLERAMSAGVAAEIATDERSAAALRGKRTAYLEAAFLLKRLDRGDVLKRKRRRWFR